MTPLVAHGVGSVQDLPVPQWLFLYGAGIVLVVSFLALAVLWRRPVLEDYRGGRPLPEGLQRILLSPALRTLLGAIGFGLLVLVTAAALAGERSSVSNLAPTFVYVLFWLGLVPVVVLLGNVWNPLNPWRAAADAVSWLGNRLGAGGMEPLEYPTRLGRWPAAAGLLLFAALELAYHDPGDPRALGLAIVAYSALTWIGALLWGRDAWFANGEAFTSYFGLLALAAPFAARDTEPDQEGEHEMRRPYDGGDDDAGAERREVVARPPVVGLASAGAPRPGTIAFVAVMLGSVGFDGFSRTSWWQDARSGFGDLGGTLLNLGGLVGAVLAVAAFYLLAVATARALAETEVPLAGAFAASLVPIALVYAVSHYFSLLVVQGQFAIPLVSDPFGWGWDLFGTTDYRPNLAPLAPTTVWYVQVATLVAGHVVGLVLAHDRALALFRESPRRALRTQYPFLLLMVAYTVGGLWLLSQD